MRIIWRVTLLICATGATGTLMSYTRYRHLAGTGPDMSGYWMVVGPLLIAPFGLLAVGAVGGRRSGVGSVALLGGALAVASLSLLDALAEVTLRQNDPEIEAGARLCCVTALEYPIGYFLMLAGLMSRYPVAEPHAAPGGDKVS